MSVHPLIAKIETAQMKSGEAAVPALRTGDTVRVHYRIVDGEKERVQVFEGIVIGFSGQQNRRTVTVRKVSDGVGVERVFPVHTPRIAQIEVKRHGQVRRSKLYYLRNLRGKAAKISERRRY